MMDRLTGQADYCRERALVCCQLLHNRKLDLMDREQLQEMAARWFALARSYKLAEEVSGFLDWASRRLEPPDAFEGEGNEGISADLRWPGRTANL